jgi:hypothetical protein
MQNTLNVVNSKTSVLNSLQSGPLAGVPCDMKETYEISYAGDSSFALVFSSLCIRIYFRLNKMNDLKTETY